MTRPGEVFVDKRGLKVRIGQFSGDGGALVFHGNHWVSGNRANRNKAD